jgi:hypothetical protein
MLNEEQKRIYKNNAARVTRINIADADTYVVTYKEAIRELISQHITPVDWKNATTSRVTVTDINNCIRDIRSQSGVDINKIYNYKIKGPGEFLLFLIIEDAILMPDKEAEIDMKVGTGSIQKNYQIKSYATSDELVRDLRIGGIEISSFATKLMALKVKAGITDTNSGVTQTQIQRIKAKSLELSNEFTAIEKEWAKYIYEQYFKKVDFIFLDSGGKTVKSIKSVKPEDITLQRYDSGIMRPTVKLK